MNNPTHNRDAILLAWSEAQKRRKAVEEEERQLRKEAIAACFGRLAPGVSRLELGNGWELKGVNYLKYEIKRNGAGDYSHIPRYLAQLPDDVAGRIINWKAELNTSVYKDLTKEEQLIVNNFVTLTDGSPQLEIVPPTK